MRYLSAFLFAFLGLISLVSETRGQNFGNIPPGDIIGNPTGSAGPARPMPSLTRIPNNSNDTSSTAVGSGALGSSLGAYPSPGTSTSNAFNTALGGSAAGDMVPNFNPPPIYQANTGNSSAGTFNTCIGLNACQHVGIIQSSVGVGVGALGGQLTPRSNGIYNNALGTFALAGLGDINGPGLGTPAGGTFASYNNCFGSACGQAIVAGYGNDGFGLSAINFIRNGYYNDCFGSSACLGNSFYSNSITGNFVSGSTSVTGLSANANTAGWQVGMRLDDTLGTITRNPATTIASIAPDGLSIVMSKPAAQTANTVGIIVRGANGFSPTGVSDGFQNVAFGVNALELVANGQSNVAIGGFSGASISDGSFNTMVGVNAGNGISVGQFNTLIGYDVGNNIVSGSRNILIGTGTNCQTTSPQQNDEFMLCTSSPGNVPAVYTSLVSGAVNLTVNGNITANPGLVIFSTFIGHANSDACTPGEMSVDQGFVYVCTNLGGTSNWKRATLSTF